MRMWRADPARAPQDGAHSVFVGATRYVGPLTWLRLLPRWNAMVTQMKRLPGYRGHGVYFEPPWTLGTVGFFESQDDLMAFARTGEHRSLMSWVISEDRKHATGGYIRIYASSEVTDAHG